MNEISSVFAALDIALWSHESGRLQLAAKLPAWLAVAVEPDDWARYLAGLHPVLGDFLADAPGVWDGPVDPARLGSGPWMAGPDGRQVLQAWALRCGGSRFLAIESLTARQAEGLAALQRARETNLLAETLNRRALQLEDSARAKSEFLARLGHEFKTPLNAVIGFSMLLSEQKAGSLNKRQRFYVDAIRIAGRQLLDVVNELLDLTRIDSGVMRLNLEQFTIESLVQESLTPIWIQAQQAGVDVFVESQARDLIVTADRVRLRQVLVNLLSNAVRHTPSGGIVRLTAHRGDGVVTIEVHDNGVGIPEACQSRIFEEFYQADNQRGDAGTGLGLAISKRLVEQQGGSIGFSSKPGVGSTFWFRIPVTHP
ncbi:MAG: HAMP domain-containing histidine kinase [Acidobacteria bacterium]|nr:HAMP domain-containing histidine kinase [Acidobacteriota bacterium]